MPEIPEMHARPVANSLGTNQWGTYATRDEWVKEEREKEETALTEHPSMKESVGRCQRRAETGQLTQNPIPGALALLRTSRRRGRWSASGHCDGRDGSSVLRPGQRGRWLRKKQRPSEKLRGLDDEAVSYATCPYRFMCNKHPELLSIANECAHKLELFEEQQKRLRVFVGLPRFATRGGLRSPGPQSDGSLLFSPFSLPLSLKMRGDLDPIPA